MRETPIFYQGSNREKARRSHQAGKGSSVKVGSKQDIEERRSVGARENMEGSRAKKAASGNNSGKLRGEGGISNAPHCRGKL
jgi:hypothetical protein